MRKKVFSALLLLSTIAYGSTTQLFKDNSDVPLTLSQDNYNRLLVKNDKIVEAVFPQNTMGIKRDEQDGSVYVMPVSSNPFTLFLTTENGRHFSVTINSEVSLGKTVELIPSQLLAEKTNANPVKTALLPNNKIPETILSFINHMERHEPEVGVTIKHHYGKALRYGKGLTLLPKESWVDKNLQGEMISLYNGGKEPISLSQEWFVEDGVLAIKLSKTMIAPHETVMLYRVQGVNHG